MILLAGWDSDDHTLPHQVQPTWQIATLTSLYILDLVSRDKLFSSIIFQLLIF